MGQTKKCASMRELAALDEMYLQPHARAQTHAIGVENVE
jgi:hypothetical protein